MDRDHGGNPDQAKSQEEQTFYTPTRDEFLALRDLVMVKFHLDMGPRSIDKAWLAHYLWSNPETRHARTASRPWTVWFGPPKRPIDLAIRYRTLQELYALPVWLVRADIEATELWRHMWRRGMAERISYSNSRGSWYHEGSLVGGYKALEWLLNW